VIICLSKLFLDGISMLQGWLQIDLAAFEIGPDDAGKRTTLYDPVTDEPVIDIMLRSDVGSGYYENERFKVLHFYKEDALVNG
jgi:hypothetical protein